MTPDPSDYAMSTEPSKEIFAEGEVLEELPTEILKASTEEIANRVKLLENEIKIMKSEKLRLEHEKIASMERIKDNKEKIKLNKQLPYLVSNVVEVSVQREIKQ